MHRHEACPAPSLMHEAHAARLVEEVGWDHSKHHLNAHDEELEIPERLDAGKMFMGEQKGVVCGRRQMLMGGQRGMECCERRTDSSSSDAVGALGPLPK